MGPEIDRLPQDHYILPDALRSAVSGGYGTLLQTEEVARYLAGTDVIAAVGDIVSLTCKELGIAPKLFVCDFKTQRGHRDEHLRGELADWGDLGFDVPNPPATITRQAWQAVRDGFAVDGMARIVVDGEEDLLGIPCFLEAPIGAKVLYGKPGKGLVAVDITREFQDHVADLVDRMEGG